MGPGQGGLDGAPGVRGAQDAAPIQPGRVAASCDSPAGGQIATSTACWLSSTTPARSSATRSRVRPSTATTRTSIWRLKALAYFLATQHNRTANGRSVDFDPDCRYFDTVVGRLKNAGRIGQWDVEELLLVARLLAGAAPDVAGPAGLAARRRDAGELPVRSRHGRRRDRPGTHEARGPDVRRRAGRRRAPARLHARRR